MKRIMSIAAIALFMAGSSVFACDSCGCTAKKAEAACAACKEGKTCDACAAKKAEAEKAKAAE